MHQPLESDRKEYDSTLPLKAPPHLKTEAAEFVIPAGCLMLSYAVVHMFIATTRQLCMGVPVAVRSIPPSLYSHNVRD
jgi:hypothetical protein